MANLKEIRNRITSVGSTMQITSAMKMVSAAKLKRAQDNILQLRPYANKLTEILQNLSASAENSSEGVYSQVREEKNVLIVAVSSNRGLCGAFNASVIRKVNVLIANDFKGKNVSVLSIGKRANDYFKKTEYNIKASYMPHNPSSVFDDLSNFEPVAEIAEKIMQSFAKGDFDKVVIVYNQFKNAAVQILTTEQYLPVLPPEKDGESNAKADYIFEPEKEKIIQELIPKSLKTQLYKALLDSNASEHGARMTAMHKATDNAKELQKELKLNYNKARQAAITNEILEIVAGAEALNG